MFTFFFSRSFSLAVRLLCFFSLLIRRLCLRETFSRFSIFASFHLQTAVRQTRRQEYICWWRLSSSFFLFNRQNIKYLLLLDIHFYLPLSSILKLITGMPRDAEKEKKRLNNDVQTLSSSLKQQIQVVE